MRTCGALRLRAASSASFCAQNPHKRFVPARWDPVLLQAQYSAHGMCISALCRSVFGAFRITILLQNERLFIAFIVGLIYHMFLPHYCAIHLKEMYFNFTYIFTYKYITCFSWMCFKTIQRAMCIILHYHFRFVLHFYLFYCKIMFFPY